MNAPKRLFPVIALWLAMTSLHALSAEADGGDAWGDLWDEADAGWEEDTDAGSEAQPGLPFNGFVEAGGGWFTRSNEPIDNSQSLSEARARIEWSARSSDGIEARVKLDAYHDDVLSESRADLREGNLRFQPHPTTDVVIGRQTLTWGTGDLVFLNDLFPKDWISFFAGRDLEYLKKPGDAVRITQYNSVLNVDLAWSPVFNSDAHLTGERFSYFSPALPGQVGGSAFEIDPDVPDRRMHNGEVALRLFRKFGGWEAALYGYRGFFKQPLGFDINTANYYFPEMRAVGASVRGNGLGGLLNVEVSHYDSPEDPDGNNPFIPNNQDRFLAGYERELVRNVTFGVQYYLEWIRDHDALLAASPWPEYEQSERRHVVTNRLRWSLLQQKLTLGVFTFHSPDENDWFVLPSVNYRASDQWQFETGARLFGGSDEHTFLGQHADNSNAYVRMRYTF